MFRTGSPVPVCRSTLWCSGSLGIYWLSELAFLMATFSFCTFCDIMDSND